MPSATFVSHEPAVIAADAGDGSFNTQQDLTLKQPQTSLESTIDTRSPLSPSTTRNYFGNGKQNLYNRGGNVSGVNNNIINSYDKMPQSLPTPPLQSSSDDYHYQPQQSQSHSHHRSSSTISESFANTNHSKGYLSSVFSTSNNSQDVQADLSTHHIDSTARNMNPIQNLMNYVMPNNTHFAVSDNLKFILNCCMWYMSSSLTNNMGKQILNMFRFPVTLTFIQFGLVAMWCYGVATLFGVTQIRSPTRRIAETMAPLAVFLIVGHVFSSIAISRVPVSLVHTIKALAPLFTVMFYRFVFQVRYTSKVYISLLPLTLGVILACTFTFSNNLIGLLCAFLSCLVFVSQNIFNKKLIFKEASLGKSDPNKLDKMNMLFYSSALSFILMSPLWLYSDGMGLLFSSGDNELSTTSTISDDGVNSSQLCMLLLLNGSTNFAQNWFAFTTLSMTSPVTYSIASLVKRIFVIVMSILWFGQQVSFAQSLGIMLTFVGLWMYQSAKRDVDRGETKIREKSMDNVLPTSASANPASLYDDNNSNTTSNSIQSWISNRWNGTWATREGKIQ
ncbi:triose-phosphate transporter family-domain-containing protein [Circinella umbellata]|nr:triose-phosphate transporter family-domain-containing protein [Circinella umbellata]